MKGLAAKIDISGRDKIKYLLYIGAVIIIKKWNLLWVDLYDLFNIIMFLTLVKIGS